MVRRFVTTLALVALLGPASLAAAPNAKAQESDRPEDAEVCRVLDERGGLEVVGITRGECINFLSGPASPQAANFFAGICGLDFLQVFLGVANKGQCVRLLESAN